MFRTTLAPARKLPTFRTQDGNLFDYVNASASAAASQLPAASGSPGKRPASSTSISTSSSSNPQGRNAARPASSGKPTTGGDVLGKLGAVLGSGAPGAGSQAGGQRDGGACGGGGGLSVGGVGGCYSDMEALLWLVEAADAMTYLHSCQPLLIHRWGAGGGGAGRRP